MSPQLTNGGGIGEEERCRKLTKELGFTVCITLFGGRSSASVVHVDSTDAVHPSTYYIEDRDEQIRRRASACFGWP